MNNAHSRQRNKYHLQTNFADQSECKMLKKCPIPLNVRESLCYFAIFRLRTTQVPPQLRTQRLTQIQIQIRVTYCVLMSAKNVLFFHIYTFSIYSYISLLLLIWNKMSYSVKKDRDRGVVSSFDDDCPRSQQTDVIRFLLLQEKWRMKNNR